MSNPTVQKCIESDLYRYTGDHSFRSLVRCMVTNSGFRYTYVLRKCEFYGQSKKYKIRSIIFKLFRRRYACKYGYQILGRTKIGEGLYINHIGSIIINPDAVIGRNVNLTTGVIIGETTRGDKKGCPVIGDKVWIGANAVIVGNVKIGSNVLIGPNAYINCDIPDDSIEIGNPGKIIHSKNATDDYMNNIVVDSNN